MLQQVKTRREVELEEQANRLFGCLNEREEELIDKGKEINQLRGKIQEMMEASVEEMEVATCRAVFITGLAAGAIITGLAAIFWNLL